MSEISAWLFALLQRILPKQTLTALVHGIARIKVASVKNFLIRNFVRFYRVNVDEIAASVPDGFDSFNSFFIRALRDGERPIAGDSNAIVSPVDGTVSAAGTIEKDSILQAKGFRYSIDELLATDLQDSVAFENGSFATVYLAPYNYHRVHAPIAGGLRAMRYVPGQLYSVNASTVSHIPGLFARNERLVCHIESEYGPYALIFVGALNVGSISTPWTGEIRPRKRGVVTECDLHASGYATQLAKGDLLGWFNMGSTVILLLPERSCEWSDTTIAGRTLQMGQRIGQLSRRSDV